MVNYPERKRNRLKNYDYSQKGWYFVTICAKNRTEYFGEIKNDKMILNTYGKIVKQQWIGLSNQYDYVKLDEYIVMPNHVHGILMINDQNLINQHRRDRSRPVPTRKIKSLSQLIGAFKTTSSKWIHQTGLNHFAWQKSLSNIRQYIINNPLKSNLDKNNTIKHL